MGFFKRGIRTLRVRIGSLSRTRRIAGSLLVLAAMVAGLWLAFAGHEKPLVSLNVATADVSASADLLRRQGVTVQERAGRLVVPADQVSHAQSLLEKHTSSISTSFEKLSNQSDIWATQDQNDKRWLAAKMSALGRLIEQFPTVRSATVLLEPARAKTLGHSGEGASASVQVVTEDGTPISGELVQSVAELICGSISGLDTQDVHIVDSTGRSYRALGKEALEQQEQYQKFRLTQGQWCDRVRSALPYVPGLVVSVQLGQAQPPRPAEVCLSVPRSYLVAATGAGAKASDDELLAQSAGVLSRMQQSAADVAGVPPQAVRVDLHVDVPAEAKTAVVAYSPWWHLTWAGPSGLLVLGGAVLGMWWLRRGKASVQNAPQEASDDEEADEAVASRGCLAVLGHLGVSELAKLVQGEHPQTVAIVLAHLGPSKAAAVLAGMPQGEQVEVARRVASLDGLDGEVLRQVEQGLATRLAATAGQGSLGGVDAVAGMLGESSLSAGKAILQDLENTSPALASAVRQRMFSFDDLSGVDAARLGRALEPMESDEIALALCAASEDVKQRVFACLDAGKVRLVRQALNDLGPMRLSDVEAAQESLVEAVRRQELGQYKSDRTANVATKAAVR